MIKIKVEKAHGDYDYGTSKFFGCPTCPEEWLTDGTVGDNDFFFCQLSAREYAQYDKEALLPTKGFIYIFLSDDENGGYIPNVRYFDGEPETIIDDFNAGFDFLGDTDAEYSIDYTGCRESDESALLCDEGGESITLLKYDPLDENMPSFLSETEKQAFFRINKADLKALDFSKVEFTIE